METTPKLAVRVGIFIVVGVLLLLGLSLRVQRYLFRKPTGVYAYALFKDIKGLEIGAPVLLAGLEVGSVTALKFDPQKAQVEVTMFIRDPYRLKQDSKASICLKSLLGQYYMNVEFGNPASPDLPYGGTVASVEATDINKVLATVSDMGKDVKELASKLNQNVEKVSHQITSLIEENRENIKKTTESFASIAPRIDAAIDTFNDVITNVKRGKGTIGKLFADDSLYWRISSAADTLTSLTADIRTGNGTLSRLIYTDELSASAEETFARVRQAADSVTETVTENRDRITSLVASLERLTPRIRETMDNLAEVSDKINSGQGTLGKMVNDPSLFDNTRSAVNQIRATFEETEEQSVVRTVLGILVGSVM